MYAIIETGGKQLRVTPGEVVDVELLENTEAGTKVEFKNVLLLQSDQGTAKVGAPYVKGSLVKGEVVGEIRAPKVLCFRYKRRKGIRRKVGHRHDYCRVRVTEIVG
jgi:large subunit ribosomal protein L21